MSFYDIQIHIIISIHNISFDTLSYKKKFIIQSKFNQKSFFNQLICLSIGAIGGTIDMAMQEVREDGMLQEINRAQGGDWGGIYVDEELNRCWKELFPNPLLRHSV